MKKPQAWTENKQPNDIRLFLLLGSYHLSTKTKYKNMTIYIGKYEKSASSGDCSPNKTQCY